MNRLPLLSGACPTVGAICPYSSQYFTVLLYTEFQCGADMTWQQHLCPASAPNTGDSCTVVKAGFATAALQCTYDEQCTGGMLERTVALCLNHLGTCFAADGGCAFTVSKAMRVGACPK